MGYRYRSKLLDYWNSKIFGYALLSTLLLTVYAFIAVLLRQKDFGAQMYPYCMVIAGFMMVVSILSVSAKVVSWVFERRAKRAEADTIELLRDVLAESQGVGKRA